MSKRPIKKLPDEYLIEKIIGKRFRNNVLQYKVKWLGYSIKESTWEPISHLQYCEEFIEEYEDNFEDKSNLTEKYEKKKYLKERERQLYEENSESKISYSQLESSESSINEIKEFEEKKNKFDNYSKFKVKEENKEIFCVSDQDSENEICYEKIQKKENHQQNYFKKMMKKA